MIARITHNQMTPEEYLAFEEKSSVKHEYIDGQVYAMSGTTDSHNTISQNAQIALRLHLRGTECDVYIADVKAQLVHRKNYYYPDVMVTCDPQDKLDSIAKRHPKLIVEVISDSTEGFDRGDKFVDYQTFESLEEYVLINTRHKRVEVFRRAEGGLWVLQPYKDNEGADETIVELKSVGLSVPLSELYVDVRFPEATTKAPETT